MADIETTGGLGRRKAALPCVRRQAGQLMSGSGLHPPLLAFLYLGMVVAPLAIGAVLGPPALTFAAEIASGSGLAALTAMLLQFITSGRFETISGRAGLDVSMAFHRIAAGLVLALVLGHVVALAFGNGGFSIRRLTRTLTHPAAWTGVAAAGVLITVYVMAQTLRGRGLRYEVWRAAHGAGAILAAALATDHAWRLGSYVTSPGVSLVLMALLLVAGAAAGTVYLVRPWSTRRHGIVVERVARLSSDIVELALRVRSRSFQFRSGQFAWLTFGRRHPMTDNPFSFASAPADLPLLRFLVREVGDTTDSIIRLRPGAPVGLDGPHGSFVEEGRDADALVLIAGGIGIAPVLSLLRGLAARRDPRPVRLLIACRREEDHVAAGEITAMQAKLDLVPMFLVEEGPLIQGFEKGRLDPTRLESLLTGLDRHRTVAFVCGPDPMMDSAAALLQKAGLGNKQILMERFDYAAARDPVSRATFRRFQIIVAAVLGAVMLFGLRAVFTEP